MQLYRSEWEPRCEDSRAADVLAALPLPQRVLAGRGLPADAWDSALRTDRFHDPFDLPDMAAACDTILRFLKSGAFILIHGDYDADGVTAVSILTDFFKSIGAPVGWYIPARLDDGYGLSKKGCAYARAAGVGLVITVDCGVGSVEEIKWLRGEGIEVIVTDHHQCPPVLPDCAAVVNPIRPDSRYPQPRLAGAGVALKLVQALCIRLEMGDRWLNWADLAALGTVADMMPLTDENRAVVQQGLRLMNERPRPGVAALMAARQIAPGSVTAKTLGFMLAPPINAAGRMGDSVSGVACLLADAADAAEAAGQLVVHNETRRVLEQQTMNSALSSLAEHPDWLDDAVLVVNGETWHQGVVGIIAAGLTRRFLRPVIVLTALGESAGGAGPDGAADTAEADRTGAAGTADASDTGRAADASDTASASGAPRVYKGSARSYGPFDLLAAIASASDLLIRYGGHSQAAGIEIAADQIPAFRRRLHDYVQAQAPELHFPRRPVRPYDCEADVRELDLDALTALEAFEPCGRDNPLPSVLIRRAEVLSARTMGKAHDHLRLQVTDGAGELTCIAFGFGSLVKQLAPGTPVSLLGTPAINRWQQTVMPQLVAEDIRLITPDASNAPDPGQTETAAAANVPGVESPAKPNAAGSAEAAAAALPPQPGELSKTVLAGVYTWLRDVLPDGIGMLEPALACGQIGEQTGAPVREAVFRAVLDIYKEAGLVAISDLNVRQCRIIGVLLRRVSGKVDLYRTPTYRSISGEDEI